MTSGLVHARVQLMNARAELPLEVVLRAQGGDREAQTRLLSRYAAVLHQVVRRIAGARDAESLSQSVLERVLVALPKFDVHGSASLTTWVFTVAHHFLIDGLRKAQPMLVPVSHASQVEDEREDPVASAWRSEVRDALEVAIGQLPDDQRRVFVLVYLHEHPLEAVAQAENVPLGTVKSRLFRAKARLAYALGPHFSPGGDDGQP